MRPIRLCVAVMATATLVGGLLIAAPAVARQSGGSPCDLLDRPQALASMSGAGEVALRIRCGLIPRPVPTGRAAIPPVGPQVGPDILVNNRATDSWAHITQSEATIATLRRVMLAGWNDSGEFLTNGDLTGYGRSIDGGTTWTDMGTLPTPMGVVDAVFGDPVLAADRDRTEAQEGVFYFANLGVLANGTSILAVHKTIDGGLTWSQATNATPGAAAADFQDKEWIAVDTRSDGTGAGNVYVCWTRFTAGGQQIRLSRSTDGGATFTVVQLDLSSDTDVSGCQVAVGPEGNVYVSWTDRNFAVSPRSILFRRSTNQGTTFDPEIQVGTAPIAETITSCGGVNRTTFVDSEANSTSRAIRSTSFSDIAVGPEGNVYLVWHRAGLAGGALADISFVKSTNLGVSFGAEGRINSDVVGQQFMPSIAANKRGILRAMYYSTQLSATNRLIDVYSVNSIDQGATWTASARVTSVSFDRPQTNPNFDTGGGLTLASCYMGDYNTVDAAGRGLGNNRFNMVWGDNRLDGNPGMAGLQPDPDIRYDF